jgi:two-component system, chemotaxis family, protein-glutamate methylesterase/glutaminase
MDSENKIKLLIIDDSVIVRNLLSLHLSKFEDIEIIGTAVDPIDAMEKILLLKPDVITLDIEMPRMNGLEFIPILMEKNPLPIIIFSSLVKENSETRFKAIELGALEVVLKPEKDLHIQMATLGVDLATRIRAVKNAKIQKIIPDPKLIKEIESLKSLKQADKFIFIGSSTGGTNIIQHILMNLPSEIPPILIVQHMPEAFTGLFAGRLNQICKNIEVREAKHNEDLKHGLALIAPGDQHLSIKRVDNRIKTVLSKTPKVNRFRPSVDVLFNSAAEVVGKIAIGVILTGMGDDGSSGMLKLKSVGAKTIAQSPKTCTVDSMPQAAIKKNAIDYIEDFQAIPKKILQLLG